MEYDYLWKKLCRRGLFNFNYSFTIHFLVWQISKIKCPYFSDMKTNPEVIASVQMYHRSRPNFKGQSFFYFMLFYIWSFPSFPDGL
jgi:hypothetical protein